MSETMIVHATGRDQKRAKDKTLTEFIDELRADNPDVPRERLRQIALSDLRTRFLTDDGWETVIVKLIEEGLRIHVRERRPRAVRPSMKEQRSRIKQDMRQRFDDRVEELVSIRLLGYATLLEGKPLGDCTGADCKKLSIRDRDFYAEIAKRLRPGEHVRNHLSEAELQAIYRDCRLAP